jgi:hypothetical protein
MKHNKRFRKIDWLALYVVFVLLPIACGLPDAGTTAEGPIDTPEATGQLEPSPTETPLPLAVTPTAPPEAALLEPHPLLGLPGMVEMQNLVPESGLGGRPRLEWQEIAGATSYGIVIFEPDGTPYWAWQRELTWVYVAGIDEALPEQYEGPVITEGMSWYVVAYDEARAPIAVGGPWPIAP